MTLDITFDPPEEMPFAAYLEVVESTSPPGVTMNNGMYRMVRLDLFHHDVTDAFFTGPALPSTMDAGEAVASRMIMSLFGLDHVASARDGLAVLGIIQSIAESSKTVPFEGFGAEWRSRYRLEVVAPSLTGSVSDFPRRYLVRYRHWSGVDLSMHDRLFLADFAKQIVQPVSMGVADPALIVSFLALLFDMSSANSATTTGLTALNGFAAMVKEALEESVRLSLPSTSTPHPHRMGPVIETLANRLLASLGDSDAVIRRLTILTKWVGVLGWIDTGLSFVALLDKPTYNFLIDTPVMRPLVSVTPQVVEAVVSMPFAATPSISWQSLTDQRSWTWVAGQSVMKASASERGGAVILRHPMMPGNELGMPFDGAWVPMRLEIRVEEVDEDGHHLPASERLLRAEAWDRFAHGFDYGAIELGAPWEFFVPERPGLTWVQVTVTALDLGPYPDARRVGFARVPVEVEAARPSITVAPDGTAHVGESRAPRIEVTLPDGLVFATDRPFHATVTPEAGGAHLRISEISVPGPTRWSEEPEERRLPFDIVLEQEANPAEHYPAIFFDPPGSEQILLIDTDTNLYDSMGPYVAFRNTGGARILISLARNELSEGYDLSPVAAITYEVEPTELRLEVKSQDDPDDNGSIVIENRMRNPGELVGSFRLSVWAHEDRLYHSEEVAHLEGTCSGPWLRLTRITVEDGWARTRELPFGISIELLDAGGSSNDVARFTLREHGFAGEGAFSVRATLRDVLRAVRHGECSMRVALEPRTGTDPARPVYELPQAQSLRVIVPQPLTAELLSWTDEDGTMNLGAPPREVIRSSATVRGRITHHRAHSITETVSLVLRNGDAPDRSFDLLDPGTGATWTGDEFSLRVTGIRRGTIDLDLQARNAIHDLEQLLNASDRSSFQGVLPRAVRITQPTNEQIVIRRGMFIDAHRERATHFELRDNRSSLPLFSTTGMYNGSGVHQWVSLPDVPNNHALTAWAKNDLGETVSEIVDVNAQPPIIEEFWIEPIGGSTHSPNDQHFYGNSTRAVRINGRVRYATEAFISGTGLGGPVRLDLSADGGDPWVHHFSREMPLTALNTHVWDVLVKNEFSSTSRSTPTVRRRGNVFHTPGLTVTIATRLDGNDSSDDNDFIEITVTFPGGATQTYDAQPSRPVPLPEVTASSSDFLFLYSIEWSGMTHGSNFLRTPKNVPARLAIMGSGTDPDWRVIRPYALIPSWHVQSGNNHPEAYIESSRGRAWAYCDLASGSGGWYPVVWV